MSNCDCLPGSRGASRVVNLTYDRVGRWKALQASSLYERRAYLTEVYRNALANKVWSPGYEIEPRRDSCGWDLDFEIHGVSDKLLEQYSQRSHSATRPLKNSKNIVGGSRQTMKWPCWFANPARISSQRLPQSKCASSNKRACRRKNRRA